MTFFKDNVNNFIVLLFILAIIIIIVVVYSLFFEALYSLWIQISEGPHRNILCRTSTKAESSENRIEMSSSSRKHFFIRRPSRNTVATKKTNSVRSQSRYIIKKGKRRAFPQRCDLEKISKQTPVSSSKSACSNEIFKSISNPNTMADGYASGNQPQLGTSRSLAQLETESHTDTLSQIMESSDMLAPSLINKRTDHEHFEAELIKEIRRISARIKKFRSYSDSNHNRTQQSQLYKNSEEFNTSASLQNSPQQDLEAKILPNGFKDKINDESFTTFDCKLARLKKLEQKVIENCPSKQLVAPSNSSSLAARDEQKSNESQKGETCKSTEKLEIAVSNKEADKSESVYQTAPCLLNGNEKTVIDIEREEDNAKLTSSLKKRKSLGKIKTFKEFINEFNSSENSCSKTSNFAQMEERLDNEKNTSITAHSLANITITNNSNKIHNKTTITIDNKVKELTMPRTHLVESAGKVTTYSSSLQNPPQMDNELPVLAEDEENRKVISEKVACKLTSKLKKQKKKSSQNDHLNQPSTPSLNCDLLIKKCERITYELQNKEITQSFEKVESSVWNQTDEIELPYVVVPLTKKRTKFNAKVAANITQGANSDIKRKRKLGESLKSTKSNFDQTSNRTQVEKKLDIEVNNIATDDSLIQLIQNDSLSIEWPAETVEEENRPLSSEWEMVANKKYKKKVKTNVERAQQIYENGTGRKYFGEMSHEMELNSFSVTAATAGDMLEANSCDIQNKLNIEVDNIAIDSSSKRRKLGDSLNVEDPESSLGHPNGVEDEKRSLSPEWEIVIKKKRKNIERTPQISEKRIEKQDAGETSHRMSRDLSTASAATNGDALEPTRSNMQRTLDTEIDNTTVDGFLNNRKLEDSLRMEDPKASLGSPNEVEEEKRPLSPEWEVVIKKKKKRKDIEKPLQICKSRIEQKGRETSYKLDGDICTISTATEELTTTEKDSDSISISIPEVKNKIPSFSAFSNSGRLYSDMLKLNSEAESFGNRRTRNCSALNLSAQEPVLNPFFDRVSNERSMHDVGSATDGAWWLNIRGRQNLQPLTAQPLSGEQKQECQIETRMLNQGERAEKKVSDWTTWKDETASYSVGRILSSGVEKIDEKAMKTWDMWNTGGISVLELIGEQQKRKSNVLENVEKKSSNESKETKIVAMNPVEILSASVERQRREVTETTGRIMSLVINLDVGENEGIHNLLKKTPCPVEGASQQRDSVDTMESISDLRLSEEQLPESVGLATNEWTPNWREIWIETWKKAEAGDNVLESVYDAKSKWIWQK